MKFRLAHFHVSSFLLCAATCVSLLCSTTSAALQPAAGTIELASTIELTQLVDLAAKRLGLNIEYDTHLSGSVTLRLHKELSDAALWSLTNRLLASHTYTTVRMADSATLSVVSLSSAASLARLDSREAFESNSKRNIPGPGFHAVLVPIRVRSVDDIVAAIKPMLSSQAGSITALPQSNAVILADLTPKLTAALRLIDSMDSIDNTALPVTVPLTHLGAARLLTLLEQISAVSQAVGDRALRGTLLPSPDDRSIIIIAPPSELPNWRKRIEQFDTPDSVTTIVYTPKAFSVSEVASSLNHLLEDEAGIRIVADELTNSLHISATPAQHARVEAILSQLTLAPEAARRPTRTFPLKNRDAADVLSIVESLLNSGYSQPSPSSAGLGTNSSAPTPIPASESAMQLTADPATNSIIAVGQLRELVRLGDLLKDLDVRRPQVLLEVLIVSLSESDSVDLGIEMEKLVIGPGNTIAKLSSLFGLSSTDSSASSIGDRGSGGSAIILNPGDFSVVLRALKSINNGRSLSMPKILVASNEQASLNSVLETPFTTLNASNTVATTSFGGSSSAGTEVSVTPQIAQGDHLRLEYSISLSAFVGEAADASVPPPKQQNTIDSVATIPDGYTIAVGGIELITEGHSQTGIPLLSDIPLIGEAFKNRSNSSSRSRFYVFIRPTILRNRSFEDLKYLSELDMDQTGIDDSWPVVQPRLIQ